MKIRTFLNAVSAYLAYLLLLVIIFNLAACKSQEEKQIPQKIASIETEFQSDKSVLVKWNSDPLAKEYKIQWSISIADNNDQSEVTILRVTDTLVKIDYLPGETIYIIISGVGEEEGPASEKIIVEFPPAIPGKVEKIVTEFQSDKSLLVKWDSDPIAKEYKIQWSINNGENNEPSEVTIVKVADAQVKIEYLAGETININIIGIGDEEGPVSENLNIIFPPAAPQGLLATAEISRNILEWESVKSAINYIVYVKNTNNDENLELLAEVSNTQYVHENVIPESELKYSIIAVNEAGQSFSSEELNVKSLFYQPLIRRPLNDTGVRYTISDANVTFYEDMNSRTPYLELPTDPAIYVRSSGSPILHTLYSQEFYPKMLPEVFSEIVTEPEDFPGQDGSLGRDVNTSDDSDGKGGFSFVKLDKVTGAELSADSEEFGCVKDNVTGLVWENKTNNSNIEDLHSAKHRILWYDPNPNTNGGDAGDAYSTSCGNSVWGNTQEFIEAVNVENLCGFSDWRLPTIEELRSIIDYEVKRGTLKFPAMTNQKYFPNVAHTGHKWTSQTFLVQPDKVYGMHMHEGAVQAHDKRCQTDILPAYHYDNGVMLVRASNTNP